MQRLSSYSSWRLEPAELALLRQCLAGLTGRPDGSGRAMARDKHLAKAHSTRPSRKRLGVGNGVMPDDEGFPPQDGTETTQPGEVLALLLHELMHNIYLQFSPITPINPWWGGRAMLALQTPENHRQAGAQQGGCSLVPPPGHGSDEAPRSEASTPRERSHQRW